MPPAAYEAMSDRCVSLSKQELDFEKQIKECHEWLMNL